MRDNKFSRFFSPPGINARIIVSFDIPGILAKSFALFHSSLNLTSAGFITAACADKTRTDFIKLFPTRNAFVSTERIIFVRVLNLIEPHREKIKIKTKKNLKARFSSAESKRELKELKPEHKYFFKKRENKKEDLILACSSQ